jgi:hypothetical protein
MGGARSVIHMSPGHVAEVVDGISLLSPLEGIAGEQLASVLPSRGAKALAASMLKITARLIDKRSEGASSRSKGDVHIHSVHAH